jgi:predicted small metal-binding protein
MDKKIQCKDIGLECNSMICGRTEEEVLTQAGQHILSIHGIGGSSKEFYNKARSAIREGDCESGDAEETNSEDCSSCGEAYFGCADECCC